MYFTGLPYHSFGSENDLSNKTILDMAGHHRNQYNTIHYVMSIFGKTDGVLILVVQSLSALHLFQHPA